MIEYTFGPNKVCIQFSTTLGSLSFYPDYRLEDPKKFQKSLDKIELIQQGIQKQTELKVGTLAEETITSVIEKITALGKEQLEEELDASNIVDLKKASRKLKEYTGEIERGILPGNIIYTISVKDLRRAKHVVIKAGLRTPESYSLMQEEFSGLLEKLEKIGREVLEEEQKEKQEEERKEESKIIEIIEYLRSKELKNE